MKIFDLIDENYIISKDDIFDTECSSIASRETKDKDALLFLLPKAMGKEENEYNLSECRAKAVVAEQNVSIKCSLPIIRVSDARAAYSVALSRYYDINYKNLSIIGITGTNGKTSTATIIFEALRHLGKKCGFIGTGKILINEKRLSDEGYSMTTPDPDVLYKSLSEMQKSDCEFVVMEVSSHALALKKVLPIRFRVAAFSTLSSEHMDFHKDIENYYEAKRELFSLCDSAVINVDDKYGKRLYESLNCKKVSVGIIENADCYITDLELDGLEKTSFIYRKGKIKFPVNLKLPGTFNVYNAHLSISVLIELGVKPCEVKEAVSRVEKIEGRMEIIKDSVTVVIDYAHTPLALETVLKTLNSNKNTGQKLCCVFGCGGERDREKRAVMGKIATENADFTIITEDNNRGESFDSILSDIENGIALGAPYTVIRKREEAIFSAIMRANDNDIVALIGKGDERYKITGDKKIPFDERVIVKCANLARNGVKNEN